MWLDVVFTEEEWGDFCSRLTRGTDRKLRGKIQRINILSRVPEKRRIQAEADEIKIDGLAVILPTNQRMGLECFASTECVSEAAVSSYVWKNEVATHDTIRSNFARLQKSRKGISNDSSDLQKIKIGYNMKITDLKFENRRRKLNFEPKFFS